MEKKVAEAVQKELALEVERIVEHALQARGLGPVDLGTSEFVIRGAMHRVGAVVLEQLLNADHGGHCGPRVECDNGHQAEFVGYRTRHLQTILGTVQVRRAYYHCAQCRDEGGGVIPKDRDLDVVGTSFSPGLRRLMARVGAQEPFDTARQDLSELAAVVVPTKAVERIAETVGAMAERVDQAERARILAGQGPAVVAPTRLYVAMDGTGVPAVPKELQDRAGKGPDGKAKTREAKLGCVFTQASFDEEGWPVRDPASTSYVGAIESAEEFGPRLHAEAMRRGLKQARTVVVLGDGAPWIWNLAEAHFPTAVQIVDLYHAREHVAAAARLAFGSGTDHCATWVAARQDELDDGDVEAVIAAIRALPTLSDPKKQHEVQKEAGYFETNQLRMCYKHFRARGFFVGSGVIEAGCKTVIGQRLKQSGMRWSVRGANAVLQPPLPAARPRMRRTSLVVEYPSAYGSERTEPPRARTTSAPTMRSGAQSPPFTRTSGCRSRMSCSGVSSSNNVT